MRTAESVNGRLVSRDRAAANCWSVILAALALMKFFSTGPHRLCAILTPWVLLVMDSHLYTRAASPPASGEMQVADPVATSAAEVIKDNTLSFGMAEGTTIKTKENTHGE